jgi:hypothetical protein
VLQLQLIRFGYEAGSKNKLTDAIYTPATLDFSPYLQVNTVLTPF